MGKVILLINVAAGRARQVAESLRTKNIEAKIVMGSYDIVAEADGDVVNIVTQVQQIDGVEKVFPQFS